jgi:hypothetical protein
MNLQAVPATMIWTAGTRNGSSTDYSDYVFGYLAALNIHFQERLVKASVPIFPLTNLYVGNIFPIWKKL